MDIATGTRASDSERQHVADLLGRHLGQGRLDLAEYEQRVARVYVTTTREDLQAVLSDLPKLSRQRSGPATPAREAARVPIWQRIEGSAWLGVGLLCLAIWGLISVAVGEFTYPWPIWVIGPWGAALVLRVLTGWESRRCRRPGTDVS